MIQKLVGTDFRDFSLKRAQTSSRGTANTVVFTSETRGEHNSITSKQKCCHQRVFIIEVATDFPVLPLRELENCHLQRKQAETALPARFFKEVD